MAYKGDVSTFFKLWIYEIPLSSGTLGFQLDTHGFECPHGTQLVETLRKLKLAAPETPPFPKGNLNSFFFFAKFAPATVRTFDG